MEIIITIITTTIITTKMETEIIITTMKTMGEMEIEFLNEILI